MSTLRRYWQMWANELDGEVFAEDSVVSATDSKPLLDRAGTRYGAQCNFEGEAEQKVKVITHKKSSLRKMKGTSKTLKSRYN